jgi:hypothetical protein
MSVLGRSCAAGIAVFSVFLIPLSAQIGTDARNSSTLALAQLTREAGLIFSGTVLSVTRDPAQNGAVPSVRTTFKIEQGLRGVRTGEVLTIREWAGLWEAGERYRPGQRVFLFLYAASKLGLTSPVGGAAGSFSVDENGNIPAQGSDPASGIRPISPIPSPKPLPRREFVRRIRRAMEDTHGTH